MGFALQTQQSRGSRRGEAVAVGAQEQAWARGSGGLPEGKQEDDKWVRG